MSSPTSFWALPSLKSSAARHLEIKIYPAIRQVIVSTMQQEMKRSCGELASDVAFKLQKARRTCYVKFAIRKTTANWNIDIHKMDIFTRGHFVTFSTCVFVCHFPKRKNCAKSKADLHFHETRRRAEEAQVASVFFSRGGWAGSLESKKIPTDPWSIPQVPQNT